MTLADLKAEALAQVDQLRRERDEARRRAADLTKILIREGGVEGAYERQLAQALKERDVAQEALELLRCETCNCASLCSCVELESLRRERDEARAEVERLRAALKAWLDADDASGIVRDVAERQREACAKRFDQKGAGWVDRGNAEWVRATPLVTEGQG